MHVKISRCTAMLLILPVARHCEAVATQRQRGDLSSRGFLEQHSELLDGDMLQILGPL